MNLHHVRFPLHNVALWLTAYGRNGRGIGEHLWPVEEGAPPEYSNAGRQTYNERYWNPARFSWLPFNFNRLFANGFVPPLCGRRSQSMNPRIAQAWNTNSMCERCLTLATQRGIIPLTYDQAKAQSSIPQALQAEQAAWVAAGRPTEWPTN